MPRVLGGIGSEGLGRSGAASRDEEDEESKRGAFFLLFFQRAFGGLSFFGFRKRGGEKRRSRDPGRNVGGRT